MENIFEELEKKCAGFDWTYMFSDDPKYYWAGERKKPELKALIEICKKIDPVKTKSIVLKYQPADGCGCIFYREN